MEKTAQLKFKRTVQERFEQFDRENPDIYNLFKNYCIAWINKQQENKELKDVKISSKQVIGRIRWYNTVEVDKGIEDYKISDAFTSRYSRKFVNDFPQYKHCFDFKPLRAK